jgi:hypothetical protein
MYNEVRKFLYPIRDVFLFVLWYTLKFAWRICNSKQCHVPSISQIQRMKHTHRSFFFLVSQYIDFHHVTVRIFVCDSFIHQPILFSAQAQDRGRHLHVNRETAYYTAWLPYRQTLSVVASVSAWLCLHFMNFYSCGVSYWHMKIAFRRRIAFFLY